MGAPRLSARLGESAAAYQSPGKDLDAINRSLSGRAVSRAALLNAGGLVLQTLDPNSVRGWSLPGVWSLNTACLRALGPGDAHAELRDARG